MAAPQPKRTWPFWTAVTASIVGVSLAALQPAFSCQPRVHNALGETYLRCNTIRAATEMWQSAGPKPCPTVADLMAARFLGADFPHVDAWGNPFELTCLSDEVVCRTAGPDRRSGTSDDVVVPRGDGRNP